MTDDGERFAHCVTVFGKEKRCPAMAGRPADKWLNIIELSRAFCLAKGHFVGGKFGHLKSFL